MLFEGKITDLVLELSSKGQVRPCTFEWAKLVLELHYSYSISSLLPKVRDEIGYFALLEYRRRWFLNLNK
jgi:hypothetical protein